MNQNLKFKVNLFSAKQPYVYYIQMRLLNCNYIYLEINFFISQLIFGTTIQLKELG